MQVSCIPVSHITFTDGIPPGRWYQSRTFRLPLRSMRKCGSIAEENASDKVRRWISGNIIGNKR